MVRVRHRRSFTPEVVQPKETFHGNVYDILEDADVNAVRTKLTTGLTIELVPLVSLWLLPRTSRNNPSPHQNSTTTLLASGE
jgi:hypothetical protein